MDQAKRELIRAWLIKARNDLITARQIGAFPSGPLDTAIYHCQQAAEKSVKAFMAFHDHPLERTHDVERLVEISQRYESRFSAHEEEPSFSRPMRRRFDILLTFP